MLTMVLVLKKNTETLAMILKITLFVRNAKKTFPLLLVLDNTGTSRLILRLNIAIMKLILVVKSKESKPS